MDIVRKSVKIIFTLAHIGRCQGIWTFFNTFGLRLPISAYLLLLSITIVFSEVSTIDSDSTILEG